MQDAFTIAIIAATFALAGLMMALTYAITVLATRWVREELLR